MLALHADVLAPSRPARRGSGPTQWRGPVVRAVGLLAVIVLSIRTVGSPATAVLAGAWLLAAAVHYGIASLAGPVSWAAGVVLEVALLTTLSATMALVSPHPHSAVANFVVIAVPVLVGGAATMLARRRVTSQSRPRPPARPGLALSVHVVVLAVVAWISTAGHGGVAWAMSGDARNHELIVRQVVADGGLTVSELRAYPAVVNAIAALISGAGHRSGLAPGALMMHDARALAATFALATIGISGLIVAALLTILAPALSMIPRLPTGVVIVVLGGAAAGGSALVLATSLEGGFLSAFGALPIALAANTLALSHYRRPSTTCLLLIAITAVITTFAWTLLAVVPLVLLVCAVAAMLRQPLNLAINRLARKAVIGLALVAVIVVLVVFVAGHRQLEQTFEVPGSMAYVSPVLLYAMAALAVVLTAIGYGWPRGRRYWTGSALRDPAAAILVSILVIWWVASLPGNSVRSYYADKTVYMVISSSVWLLFVPALVIAAKLHGARWSANSSRAEQALRAVLLPGLLIVLVLTGIGSASALTNSVSRAGHGWAAPSEPAVYATEQSADQRQPFVFWEWGYAADTRLANFWATMTWATGPDGRPLPAPAGLAEGAVAWADAESGRISDLCRLGAAYPGLTVVTSSRTLTQQLSGACPGVNVRVVTS
jgi:hypothetical protein